MSAFNPRRTGTGEVIAIFWIINEPPGLRGFPCLCLKVYDQSSHRKRRKHEKVRETKHESVGQEIVEERWKKRKKKEKNNKRKII